MIKICNQTLLVLLAGYKKEYAQKIKFSSTFLFRTVLNWSVLSFRSVLCLYLLRTLNNRQMKLKVGDKLYDSSANEWDIISVGVKYYTVKKDYGRKKVSIIDLKYVDKNYSQSSSQFYITQQDPLDNREMLITYSEIRRYFSRNYTSKLSLEQLRQIKHIISSCN